MTPGGNADVESNPFAPPGAVHVDRASALKVFGRLNAMLLVLPLLALAVIKLWGNLFVSIPAAPVGDPVVYQHTFWIEPNPFALLLYFGVPNAICVWRRRC